MAVQNIDHRTHGRQKVNPATLVNPVFNPVVEIGPIVLKEPGQQQPQPLNRCPPPQPPSVSQPFRA